jgi:hypothetical protein
LVFLNPGGPDASFGLLCMQAPMYQRSH